MNYPVYKSKSNEEYFNAGSFIEDVRKNVMEIVAEKVTFLSSKKGEEKADE